MDKVQINLMLERLRPYAIADLKKSGKILLTNNDISNEKYSEWLLGGERSLKNAMRYGGESVVAAVVDKCNELLLDLNYVVRGDNPAFKSTLESIEAIRDIIEKHCREGPKSIQA